MQRPNGPNFWLFLGPLCVLLAAVLGLAVYLQVQNNRANTPAPAFQDIPPVNNAAPPDATDEGSVVIVAEPGMPLTGNDFGPAGDMLVMPPATFTLTFANGHVVTCTAPRGITTVDQVDCTGLSQVQFPMTTGARTLWADQGEAGMLQLSGNVILVRPAAGVTFVKQ